MTETERLNWILAEWPAMNPPLYGEPYRIAAWGCPAGEGKTWREAIDEAVRIQKQPAAVDAEQESAPPSGKGER